MKRWKKICIQTAGFLVGGIALFLCIEHFRGEWALNSKLKEFAAKGESLDYKQFLPPKVAPEQNTALDLFSLTNTLHDYFKMSEHAPPIMKIVAPGHAIVSWRRDEWKIYKQTNSWSQFSPELQPSEPALDRLQSIWYKTGFDDGLDYSKGFVDFPLMPLLIFDKETSVLLAEVVAVDLREGHFDSAEAHLHSLLALIKSLESQPLIISQLVRIACASYAFNTTWEALQSPDWTDSQLSEIQAAWTTNEFSRPMTKSFDMERALTSDTFHQLRASQVIALNFILGPLNPNSTDDAVHAFVLRHVHVPIWQFAWAAQDELRALTRWQALIDAGKLAESNCWVEAKKSFPNPNPAKEEVFFLSGNNDQLNWYDRTRFLISVETFSVNSSILLKELKMETQKNMTMTAIALKRYQLHYGKMPSDLSALIPEFMTKLPIDRMDGQPLRYHLNADGSFELYSVGTNGTDEGGDPQFDDPKKEFHNIWDGKDAVWPVEVSMDQAKAL